MFIPVSMSVYIALISRGGLLWICPPLRFRHRRAVLG